MSYVYLASPYSHADASVRESRYEAASYATAHLLNQRTWVYSPIVHCHELAKKFDLPTDFKFWKDYNFAMLSHARKLIILRCDGWEASKGVAAEKIEAERLNIPVEYL